MEHTPPGRERALSTRDAISRVSLGNRTEPLRRTRSIGGVHPEVALYKDTFRGAQMTERIMKPNETFNIYHRGSEPGATKQFFTKDVYSTGKEAQAKLATPLHPPTRRSTVVFEKGGGVVYDGIVGSAFKKPGGGRQTLIPKQPYKVLKTVDLAP